VNTHLSDEELDRLWQCTFLGPGADKPEPEAAKTHWAHVESCDSCRSRLRIHQILMQQLSGLRSSSGLPSGPGCPGKAVWLELAAGLSAGNSEYYLNHAAHCDHCGALLREASEEFASEVSAEEEAALAGLESSNGVWQHAMSGRLLKLTHGRPFVSSSAWREAWRSMRIVGWPAATIAITIVALLAFQLLWRHSHRVEPDQLVAAAYEEDRTIEVRIEGAGYAPLREARGGTEQQERMTRPALLKAEAEVAERLKTTPEDVQWLQASGRVSLLEGNWKTALTALQTAQRLDGQNLSVTIDLASAYILRGDTLGDISDYGQATELLGGVLAIEPHNGVAEFNQAVAEEKQPALKNEAIEEWKQFLADHGDAGWASEARSHLEALQAEASSKDERIHRVLWSAERISQGEESQWKSTQDDEIDPRIEAYLDIAIQQWLPASYNPALASSKTARNTRVALFKVAVLLSGRHHDRWMQDILASEQRSRLAQKAVRLMADSARLVQSSEDDQALSDAADASRMFEQVNMPAGYLYSQFTVAYVDQMLHRNAKCAAIAPKIASAAASHGYRWLEIQSRLEFAICTSMDDERGLRSAYGALRMADALGYPDLCLRARNIISALSWASGDGRDAWLSNTEGMRTYWASWSPPLRGYSFLDSLDEIAQEQQKWFLASAILRESIPMLRSNPDPAIHAFEQARLGDALLNAGATEDAEKELQKAHKLFEDLPAGSRRDMLGAEIALGLAKAEIRDGRPADAVRRLDSIRAVIKPDIEDDLRLDYFGTNGIALMSDGKIEQARSSFQTALQLAESGLSLAANEGDKLRWSRRNERLYRALVGLELHENPDRAWAYWELYKGSAVRGRNANPRGTDLRPELRSLLSGASSGNAQHSENTLLISYFLTPDRINIWVSDGKFIKAQWSNTPERKLRSMVYRFVEECENPTSDLSHLNRDGEELYEALISPIEPWLGGHTRLLIEPDGVLSLVPFSALIDQKGVYLGDRESLTISPGILYSTHSRMTLDVTSHTPILVIGNPSAPGWKTLPDADHEAHQVAARFYNSKLLVGSAAGYPEIERAIAGIEIVHFSGHGTGEAEAAGLILAGSKSVGLDALRLLPHRSVRLVVLASCDSAHGTGGMFDDADSIVRGLIASGVPTVVASSWEVDSSATAKLMDRFYEQLLDGHSISESLGTAGALTRRDPKFAHPFYWAAFSTFGKG
jgi:CHAT domain-containing protein/tetratricopeptide (TPR) repeat protein